MSAPALGTSPLVVVDVETTGLLTRTDRVLEVALVRLRPDLSVEEEFDTLVNPCRDVGATEIHGVTASDVTSAPLFSDAAGDVGSRMEGAVVVGHNVRFDLRFLSAEFERMGVHLPELPRLCTLRLAQQFLVAPNRRLETCCRVLGVPLDNAHSALGDARATTRLLTAFLGSAAEEGMRDLGELGCSPLAFPGAWAPTTRRGKRCTRSEAARAVSDNRSYLSRLVSRLPGDDATGADEAEYMALLDRVIEDRAVTAAEGQALADASVQLGLSRVDVQRAHEKYLRALVAAAWSDGEVSELESRDLLLVGQLLGVPAERVLTLVGQRPNKSEAAPVREDLRGKRVCFTGSLQEVLHQGEPLTRPVAERLAAEAGLIVCPSVTKKLDILVVADPNSASGKAAKARAYGTRILAAAHFFAVINSARLEPSVRQADALDTLADELGPDEPAPALCLGERTGADDLESGAHDSPDAHAFVSRSDDFASAVERNVRGEALEKQGAEDEAIQLYEVNAREGFDGTHPYDRLAIIWRRRKEYDREIAVVERAIAVFQQQPYSEALVAKYRARLAKAKALASGTPVARAKPGAILSSVGEPRPRACKTKGCTKAVSTDARQYCDECREIRSAPNVHRNGDHRPEKLFFGVAGTPHHHAATEVVSGERLYLVRDPSNPHDRDAIEVRRSNGDLVGYVPAHGFIQGKWGYGPYTQSDLARAMDAGARVTVQCYDTGRGGPGSVRVHGHCDGWMQPYPARLEVWAARGTRFNEPVEPLPFVVTREQQRRPESAHESLAPDAAVLLGSVPEPIPSVASTSPTIAPAAPLSPPPSWWRRLLGLS